MGPVAVRRKKLETNSWFLAVAPWMVITPFLVNTAGWILTENGRQPWIVQGLMTTAQGVSPSVTATEIWISLSVFVVLYAVLGVADGYLMIRDGRQDLAAEHEVDGSGDESGDSRSEAARSETSPPASSTRGRTWCTCTTSGS